MDNYKFAKVFERLAIKIVEEHFGYELDYEKSHVTRETRDYGIDSVIFFKDRTIYSSTIEAKLRKSEYTLALKDIASSILFFLVRKGDEHFIVSNVFITQGTIEVLELLNLQTQSKIYYIEGTETKEALEKLVTTLTDSEESELAQLLIQNFDKLKKPIRSKSLNTNTNDFHALKKNDLLDLRKSQLKNLEEGVKEKKIILLQGKIGTGKRTLLEHFNQTQVRSTHNIITIDAYIYNSIDIFCYEITRKILGLDLKELLCMFSQSEINLIKQTLNEIESESFDNIFKIFNENSLSNEVAIYLAKIYLKNLFEKFNQLKYLIEIINFSYTSQEVFDFIKEFVIDAPDNIGVVFVFSEDISAKHMDFSIRYKQLYKHMIKEVYIDNLRYKESLSYLKKQIPKLDRDIAEQIYEFTNGNPHLLDMAVSNIKKMVLINKQTVSACLSSLTIYINKEFIQILEQNPYALKFFFILHLYSFNMQKFIWKSIEELDHEALSESTGFNTVDIANLIFVEEVNTCYLLKDVYMYNDIEDYFVNNQRFLREYANKIKETILSTEPAVLTKIKLFYYCDDSQIISEYENNKHSWMFKTNTSWRTEALKYICKYMFRHETEQIEYTIESMRFFLEYLRFKKYYTEFEKNILKKLEKNKKLLIDIFSNIPKDYVISTANVLADFYLYLYSQYRQRSNYEDMLDILEHIMKDEWFTYLKDIKKIKLIRAIALLHKSLGSRGSFLEILNDMYLHYKDNSYAKVIYWANMAAGHYTKDPETALAYLEKCELESFKSFCPNENSLYLWVYMDKGIVSFYNQKIVPAKAIAEEVLIGSQKMNFLENIARAYNLLGAISLKEKNLSLSEKQFYKAVSMCIDEKSEAFFHFAVNYLVVINKMELSIVELIMDYIKIQKERLLHVFKTENLETCRWFVTLCSFNEYLVNVAPQLQKELEAVYGDYLKQTSSSLLEKYKINGLLIVLF